MIDKPSEPLVPLPNGTPKRSVGVRSDRWQRVADVIPPLALDRSLPADGVAPLRMGWGSLPDLKERNTEQETSAKKLAVLTQLQGMPVSALKKRARKLGASAAALDEADDAADTKNALIQIITGGGSVDSPDMIPESRDEPKLGEGGEKSDAIP